MALYLVDDVTAGQKVTADVLNPALGIVERGTYTPEIDVASGTVAYGADGYHDGKWHRIGTTVFVIIDIYIAGSGADFGGTSWRVELPFLADLTFHAANVLAPGTVSLHSDNIGSYQSRSGTAGQTKHGTALLSGPNGSEGDGTHVILYTGGTNSSLGNGDFTTSARLKIRAVYEADPDAF